MRSPFDDLGKTRLNEPEGEIVTGAFTCSKKDCWAVATEARYLGEVKTVSWICPKCGTISKAKINLD